MRPMLAHFIKRFLSHYLPTQKGLAVNTIMAYRDAIKLLLGYASDTLNKNVEHLGVEDINARYCSNRLGSAIASWLAGQRIRDSQSGFRLVRTDRLRGLPLRARKYEIEMEILLKLSRAGGRIEHVPIQTVYDGGRARSKMKPVRDTVRICFCSLAFRWGK